MFRQQKHEIGKRSQVRVLIDVWALLWVLAAFVMFVYVTSYVDYDQSVALKGMIGIVLGLIGLVMSSGDQYGVGAVLDVSFSMGEFSKAITTMTVAVALIFATNIGVQSVSPFFATLSIIPIGATIFSLLIGIMEEPFAHGWLLNLIENMTEDTFSGVFVSSAIMAVIHLAIYGTRGFSTLLIVFISFFVIGWLYATSTENVKGAFRSQPVPARRLSPIMTAHGLVNVTAGLRAAMIVVRVLAVLL